MLKKLNPTRIIIISLLILGSASVLCYNYVFGGFFDGSFNVQIQCDSPLVAYLSTNNLEAVFEFSSMVRNGEPPLSFQWWGRAWTTTGIEIVEPIENANDGYYLYRVYNVIGKYEIWLEVTDSTGETIKSNVIAVETKRA